MASDDIKHASKVNDIDEDDSEGDSSYERLKKIAIGLISFFGLIIVGAGIVLYLVLFNGGSRGVNLSIETPNTVTAGVPFDVVATVSNNQDTALGDTTLRLDLPPNLIYLGVANSEGGSATTDHIGDVGAGSLIKHTFKLLDVEKPGITQTLRISASYASGKSSRFEVKSTKDLSVTNSPVTLTVKMPDHIIRGSSFEFTVAYQNTTQFDFPDVSLQINYPDTFHYESSSVAAQAMNNVWTLGGLKSGDSGSITVRGTYNGPDGAALQIPVVMNAQFSGNDYEIAESDLSAPLSPSPIPLSILVNNHSDYVARIGDTLTFTIHYENKSGVALSNVVIKASIDGEMVNMNTLTTNAKRDTLTNWLTWDSSVIPAFALLDAGASGDVTASVQLKNFFPIQNDGDKNYSVKVSARLESPTVPYYMAANKLTSSISSETKISGLVGLTSQLFFRDTDADIINTGEFPPRVGKATEYTVHWVIRNFSTDIDNVTVRAQLKNGVEFLKSVQSSTNEGVTFDDATGDVIWHIEKLPATKGLVGNPVEAIFQVRATPSASDAGQFMQILGESILSATDDFTGLELNGRGIGLSTALPDDRTVGADGGRVQQ